MVRTRKEPEEQMRFATVPRRKSKNPSRGFATLSASFRSTVAYRTSHMKGLCIGSLYARASNFKTVYL